MAESDGKADKTLSYGDAGKVKREKPVRIDSAAPSGHDVTRQGVGHDPVRPPQRIDPGTRRLGRHVSVALAIKDPFERASLARSLVHAQCTVVTIDSAKLADADELISIEILVADFDAPEVYGIVDALRGVHPDLPIVALTARRDEVDRGLRALKYGRFEVHNRTARVPELIESVKRLARA